jgi:hypothetical protein
MIDLNVKDYEISGKNANLAVYIYLVDHLIKFIIKSIRRMSYYLYNPSFYNSGSLDDISS